MTEGGTQENEGADTTSKRSEPPRRRRQSATGAVDRMTGIIGRDKAAETSQESTVEEEPPAPAWQEEAGRLEDDEEGAAVETLEGGTPGQRSAGADERRRDTDPAAPVSGSSTRKGSAARAREDRVRASVDLSREQHKFLKMFAVQNDSDGMSVLRELVGMLEEEEDMAPRLVERLQRHE